MSRPSHPLSAAAWALAASALLAGCGDRPAPDDAAQVAVTAPGAWTVTQGTTAFAEFSVESRGDFITRIQLEGLPAGVTGLAGPAGPGSTVWRVELAAGWDPSPGTYPVEIVALHGDATARAPVNLVVAEAPPLTVRFVSPAEVWTRSEALVAIEVDGPGAAEATFLVDGDVWTRTTTAPFEATIDVASLPEGTHAITAYVVRGQRTFSPAQGVTLHVDRSAPWWVSRSPQGDDQWVSVRAERLEVVFSEPVRLTGTPPAVQSTPAGLQLANPRVGIDGRNLHVVYADLVGAEPGMEVQVTIDGVVDRAGNPANPVSWTWKYSDWQRLDEAALNPAGESVQRAQLLTNPAGEVYVAWSTSGAPGHVRAASVDGWGWKALGPAFASASGTFHAAIGATGELMLADLKKAYRWNGTSWDDLGDIETAVGSPGWSVRVGLDDVGEPIVAGTASDTATNQLGLRIARKAPAGWTRAFNDLSPEYKRHAVFVGAPPGGGTTYAAFYDGDRLRWFAEDSTGGWPAALADAPGLLEPDGAASSLTVYFDPAGSPVIAALRPPVPPNTASQPAILVWSGSSWTDLGPSLSAVAPGNFLGLALAWSPAGELYVARTTHSSAGTQVIVSRRDGATWAQVGDAVAVGSSNPLPQIQGIAFAGTQLYVLWKSFQNQTWRLTASRFEP